MKTNTINFFRKPYLIVGILIMISFIIFFAFNWVYKDQILVNKAFFNNVNISSPLLVNIVKKTVTKSPSGDNVTFLYRLSAVLLKQGLKKESIQILRHALKTNPENRNLKLKLADLLFNEGYYEEAERYFSEILTNNQEGTN